MTLIMEKNKSFDPLNINLFSANTIMMQTQNVASLINKTGFVHGSLLLLLKFRFGSLIRNYMIDLIQTEVIISPNCPFSNTTFRGSNCSYVYKG